MTTMGKVDTSYLMTIIRWIINISARSPKLEWTSLTYTTPYIANKIRKVTKGIISYTHSWHDIPNMHLRTPLESFSVGVQCKWANLHNDDNERKQHAWSRTRPYGHCVFGSLYRTWSCIIYTLRQLSRASIITIWVNKNDKTHPSRTSNRMQILSDIEKSEHKATFYLSLVHQNMIRYHWRLNPHCVIS